jgi:hypothetical protein
MIARDSQVDTFTRFVTDHESRLRQSLMAAFGGNTFVKPHTPTNPQRHIGSHSEPRLRLDVCRHQRCSDSRGSIRIFDSWSAASTADFAADEWLMTTEMRRWRMPSTNRSSRVEYTGSPYSQPQP